MGLLKCLDNFVPSESNLYSEEEMRDINIQVLEEKEISHLITDKLISFSNSDLNSLETNFQLRFDD